MNRKNVILAAVIFSTSLFAGCNSPTQENATADETITDVVTENTEMETGSELTSSSDIVLFTAMTNRLQSELSELAQEKATSPTVKEVSQEIAQNNNQIMIKVQDLAEAVQAELPMTLSVDQQAVYDSLSELSPEEFEQAYVEVLQRDIKEKPREPGRTGC